MSSLEDFDVDEYRAKLKCRDDESLFSSGLSRHRGCRWERSPLK